HEALVEEAVDLLVDRLDDRWQPVAEVLAADAAGEVEVLAALGVPDAGPFGAGDDERRGRDAARDVTLALGADALAAEGCRLDAMRHRPRSSPPCRDPSPRRSSARGTAPPGTPPGRGRPPRSSSRPRAARARAPG